MKRTASKKSLSWWWHSHISRKNSKWLKENLQKMDGSVKQMLKLIEDEGESETYRQRRPELISYVEDFYRMYRALAERYDRVTGDLRKNIQSQGSGRSGFAPPSPSSLHSSGSESSGSSSSEPDSGSEFDAIEANSEKTSSRLRHAVHELETELSELKSDREAAEMEIVNLKQKLEEANSNLEMKDTELEEQAEFLKEVANEKEKFLKEKSRLETQILNLEMAKMELESEMDRVIEDRAKQISELDEGVVSLKATIEVITADKDAQFRQFEMEYANLKKEKEEVDEEVDRQKIVISDIAERKREAIRQLCFSIEHYRDNYRRLLGSLQNHKRSAIVAN